MVSIWQTGVQTEKPIGYYPKNNIFWRLGNLE